jgi:hypothetical protein
MLLFKRKEQNPTPNPKPGAARTRAKKSPLRERAESILGGE